MERIDRWTAKAQGLRRFYTGKRCRKGHDSTRYTANGECVQCSDNRNDARRIEYKLDSPHIPPARLAAYRRGIGITPQASRAQMATKRHATLATNAEGTEVRLLAVVRNRWH